MRRHVAVAAMCVYVMGCESSTAPQPNDRSIVFGSSVSGSVGKADTVVYQLKVKAGQTFAVYVDALDSTVVFDVIGANGAILGSGSSTGPNTFAQWTRIRAGNDATDTIRVRAGRISSGGRFLLRPRLVLTAPERTSAAYVPNDTVVGEAIDTPADIDDFAFTGIAGQTINLFLQNLGADSTTSLAAELYNDDAAVFPPGTDPLPVAWVGRAAPSAELEAGASGRYKLTSSGHYRVRIHSSVPFAVDTAAVPYRFQLYVIDTLPERASRTLTPGDTVTESIDHVGDIDSYTISAPPGTRLNLFLEPSLPGPNMIVATVRAPGSGYSLTPLIVGAGARLLDTPSGVFVVPPSGTATVQIEGTSSGALYRGAYRLFLYAVNFAPETGSPALTLATTPISGAIDQYGDVDEYSFTLDHEQVVALRTNDSSTYVNRLFYRIISDQLGFDVGAGTLAAGTYRLRVDPGTAQSSFRGPYQFVLSSPDTAPESVTGTITANQTMSAEASAWPEDIDRFTYTASAADTIVFSFKRPPNAPLWQWSFWVTDVASGQLRTMNAIGDIVQLPRIDMAPGARYQAQVEGTNSSWAPGSASPPYVISATRVTAAPEHRAATIAIGDTIRDSLDYYGDIDDYVLTGMPGQEINVSGALQVELPWGGPALNVTLSDPSTNTLLTSIAVLPGAVWSSTVRIPASGTVKARACVGANCVIPPCGYGCTGNPPHQLTGYWLVVNAISRAPELLASTVALGDSIIGEAIDQPGDIDEFTFTGTANQKVAIGFQYYTDGSVATPALGLQLEVVDVATSSVLTTITTPSAQLDDASLPVITFPRDGTYLVRVQAQVQLAYDNRNWGPYRFRLAAVP